MSSLKHKYFSLLLLCILLALQACGQNTETKEPVLTLNTSSGTHSFDIEIADTVEKRSVGLMGRTDLSERFGMLFVFPALSLSSFWMKDTPTSLDIIFISDDLEVLQIATNTVPFSEDLISPERSYLYVLEVIAGTAERIGLKVGDTVELPTSLSN